MWQYNKTLDYTQDIGGYYRFNIVINSGDILFIQTFKFREFPTEDKIKNEVNLFCDNFLNITLQQSSGE